MGDLLNSGDLIMCFCTNAGIELYNNLIALKNFFNVLHLYTNHTDNLKKFD